MGFGAEKHEVKMQVKMSGYCPSPFLRRVAAKLKYPVNIQPY